MSEHETILSVVIPVYNAEGSIREALDSLLNQSLKEIEVICVDDGSTDRSVDVIRTYTEKDPRVTLIRQKNQYAGAARNKGIDAAKGEYLFFLDSDDYVLDYALEAACRKARKHRLDCLKFLSLTLDEKENRYIDKPLNSGSQLRPEDFDRLLEVKPGSALLRIGVTPWSGIYRRAFLLEKHCRFNGLRCVNDRSFYTKVMTNAERIMISRDRVTVHRVNQDESLVGTRANHFDCQVASVRLTEEQLREDRIDPAKTELIMRQEYQDLVHWYRQFAVNDELKESMRAELDGYFRDGGSAYDVILRYRLRAAERMPAQQRTPEAAEPFRKRCEQPAVTVLVPVRDEEDTLNEALACLTEQTLAETEYLLLCAGATEGCRTILKEYAALDERFEIVEGDETSLGKTMNAGIARARGEYIAILMPGDRAEKPLYETLYREAKRHQPDMVRTDYGRFRITEEGEMDIRPLPLSGNPARYGTDLNPAAEKWLLDSPVQTRNALYRRDYLTGRGVRYHEGAGFILREDGFWFLSLCKAERVRLAAMNEEEGPLYLERTEAPEQALIPREAENNITQEYRYIQRALDAEPKLKAVFEKTMYNRKLNRMLTVRSRVAANRKLAYARHIQEELREPRENGKFDEDALKKRELSRLTQILADPKGMTETTDVSVILPVRAGEDPEPCARTLLCRTEPNLEILCVAADRDEKTWERLQALAVTDGRIRALRAEKPGTGAARNAGIRHARGNWLYFAEPGNRYETNLMDRIWGKGEAQQLDVLTFPTMTYSRDTGTWTENKGYDPSQRPSVKTFPGNRLKRAAFTAMNGWVEDKLFRTAHIEGLGLAFPEEGEDTDPAFVFPALLCAARIDVVQGLPMARLRRRSEPEGDGPADGGYYALTGLRDNLKRLGLFEGCEKDFVNYALHYSMERLTGAPEAAYPGIYDALRDGRLEELGIYGRPAAYFQNQEEFALMSRMNGMSAGEFLLYYARNVRLPSAEEPDAAEREEAPENPLLQSRTYKVGAAVLWLPKKLRTGKMLVKKYGAGFALKYLKQKLRGRAG